MLYEYLKTHYQTNEPIFLSDVILPDVTNNYIRQMFKQLCDCGKLMRFNTGIYYLPEQGRSSITSAISAEAVAMHKYISRGTDVCGYYSGQTFAAQINLTSRPVNLLEIVSNYAGGKYREITLGDSKIILRKPKQQINNENWKSLQFLDFIKDIDLYADYKNDICREIVKTYIWKNHITKDMIDQYISSYPDKIYRIIYEMELHTAFYSSLDSFESEVFIASPNRPTPQKRRRELSVELL